MANADNINIIIERIRDEDVGFTMIEYFANHQEVMSRERIVNALKANRHACGTVACIAGHAYVEAAQAPLPNEWVRASDIERVAAGFLGLSIEDIHEARKLFRGTGNGQLMIDGNGLTEEEVKPYRYREEFIDYDLGMITREDAIQALEILRDEGVVDWDKAILGSRRIRYAYLPGRI